MTRDYVNVLVTTNRLSEARAFWEDGEPAEHSLKGHSKAPAPARIAGCRRCSDFNDGLRFHFAPMSVLPALSVNRFFLSLYGISKLTPVSFAMI